MMISGLFCLMGSVQEPMVIIETKYQKQSLKVSLNKTRKDQGKMLKNLALNDCVVIFQFHPRPHQPLDHRHIIVI